jgi:hypothetical protein
VAKRETSRGALIGAVVVGGFCLITGATKALVDGGRGEYGIAWSPLNKWAYPAVGIAAGVMALAVFLLVRRIRGKR